MRNRENTFNQLFPKLGSCKKELVQKLLRELVKNSKISEKKMSLIMLLLTFSLAATFPVKSTPITTIYVDPEISYAGVGKTFTVNLTVAEVDDLWGWDFQIFYASTRLNGTLVEEGPFLKTVGDTFFWIVNFTDNYNTTHGYIFGFCHLTHVIPGANGNGTLAAITFKSKAVGKSTIHITGTHLKKSTGEYVSHETRDGIVIIGKLGDLGSIPVGWYAFDDVCDYQDLFLFGDSYVNYYHPLADLDNNGNVDYMDLYEFGNYYIGD